MAKLGPLWRGTMTSTLKSSSDEEERAKEFPERSPGEALVETATLTLRRCSRAVESWKPRISTRRLERLSNLVTRWVDNMPVLFFGCN